MADSTVYARTTDSWTGFADATWATARGAAATNGSGQDNSGTAYDFGVYNIYTSGRGGATFTMRRSFFDFDLSGESSEVASAEVKLHLDWLGSGIRNEVILVAATALAGNTYDYGNVFHSGTSLGSTYSDSVSVSTTAGYHTFTMTAAAITDINSAIGSGNVVMGLMGAYYDHSNNAPPINGDFSKVRVIYSDYSGTGSDPKLELTYAAADDAIFFGANF